MIFGRGGVGGVINRVTRQADWGQAREASRCSSARGTTSGFTADVGRGLNDAVAVRATGALRGLRLLPRRRRPRALRRQPDRWPFALGPNTTLRASYEYFHDERTADRGIPSFNGRPVETDPGTFFGDPTQSPTDADGQPGPAAARAPLQRRA